MIKTRKSTTLSLVVLLLCLFHSSTLRAEYFGSLNGRTAQLSNHPEMTVEATVSSGEFLTSDYQQMGIRLNYQYSSKVTMFGGLGRAELGSRDETSYGFGGFYSLGKPVLWSDNSAIKLSVHQVNFGVRPGSLNCGYGYNYFDPYSGLLIYVPGTCSTGPDRGGRIRNIAIELLLSGAIRNSIIGDSANWYANGGIQLLNGDYTDDTVLGIGAGVVFPLNTAEVYAGWEYADEVFIGAGVRYFVK